MMHFNRSLSTRRLLTVCTVFALLVMSGCGGDDTSSLDPSDPTGGATTTNAGATTTAPTNSKVGSLACHDLFSDEEIAELFSEPAVLEEEQTNPSIGQTVCTWGTVENPDDPDDAAAQTLTIQVYSGDPIPGGNFYGTKDFVSGEVTEVDGIGDEAFVTDDLSMNGFLDGDVAGFVSYFVIEFGESDQVRATEDQVTNILRLLHERVT